MTCKKDHSKPNLKDSLLLFGLAGLGTLLRFWMALHTQDWKLTSEHNAWQLLLEESVRFGPQFDQFIGYPHELGGALVSVPALLWIPFQPLMPGLSISALLLDSLVRWVLVWSAVRVVGRNAGIWFAIWTVAAVPSVVSWSFVAANLHASSAVFPLVVMWLATARSLPKRLPRWLLLGVTLGLATAWSHSTLTLLPVGLAAVVVTSRDGTRGADLVKSAAAGVLVLTPFLLVEWWLNHGYALEGYSPFWNEVLNRELPSLGVWWTRFRLSWTHSFPGSTVLASLASLSSDTTRLVWALLVYAGVLVALFDRQHRVQIWIGFGCFVSFMVVYPLNSFWLGVRDLGDHSAYLYYRHLPFVIPVVVLIAIHGLLRLYRFKWVAIPLLVAMGMIPACRSMAEDHHKHEVSYRAQAWVLGRKLGHDPLRLGQLLTLIPPDQDQAFLIGYGWGLTDAVLKLAHHSNDESPQILARILVRYPDDQQAGLLRGVDYAFEVTPGLDPGLRKAFYNEMEPD